MRWAALFDDMEVQFAAALQSASEEEAADLYRSEQGRVALTARLAGQGDWTVTVRVAGGQNFTGRISHVGSEWLVMRSADRSVLIPLAAVQVVQGLGRAVGATPTRVHARLGLASALRTLSRDRQHVSVYAGSADARYDGVLDRIGRDFLELALVPTGEERRSSNVQGVVTMPFAAVSAIVTLA
ncbi:hypothetical protein [Arthrobacter sp. Br18]|uniref:hypothetical protein n=1 Tax=Arthrobacter sp. Br18 TaxID=1312954 RepID=UPI00047B0876|nr:hypothetical protein [Arthrobacter sp. Br18]